MAGGGGRAGGQGCNVAALRCSTVLETKVVPSVHRCSIHYLVLVSIQLLRVSQCDLGMQAVAAAERERRAADGRLEQLEADLTAAQVQPSSREMCRRGADALARAFGPLQLVGQLSELGSQRFNW